MRRRGGAERRVELLLLGGRVGEWVVGVAEEGERFAVGS